MFTAWVKDSLLGSRKIEFITWVNPSGEYSLLGQIHNLGQNKYTILQNKRLGAPSPPITFEPLILH